MRVAGATIAFCLLLAVPSLRQGLRHGRSSMPSAPPEPPEMDGWLNDPCWRASKPVNDFVQFDPVEGAAPSETTTVRLLYDDDALYVGVVCSDSDPRAIVRRLSRRDRTTEADRFTVMIDSYMDRQTGFVFSTNVSGVQSDGVLSQGGSVYDITWDAVWTVRTRHYGGGWSAEFAIPWNALRFAKDAYHWGINFRRYISRKKETVEWVMVPRSETYAIPLWGIVDGLHGIRPPLHLEIAPYVSATRTMTTGQAATGAPAGEVFRAGADLKYGLSRNFTLDATINPDFGQVEVDQSVLNLTVFETRFPEKRPFFVEGAQMFTFGGSVDNTPLTLFFTRRLGRQPHGASLDAFSVRGTTLEENPQVTTILGAVKVTGRTADGLSVAALSSLTDEEHAVFTQPDGASFRVRTEPRGSYHVARIKQEWQDGSWLGGMAHAHSSEGESPRDVRWYRLECAVVRRTVHSGRLSRGNAYSVRRWRGRTSAGLTPQCRALVHNGILRSSTGGGSTRMISASLPSRTITAGTHSSCIARTLADGIFRRYFFALNPEVRWNWDGVRTHALVRGEAIGEFSNFWLATLTMERAFPAYDDAEKGIVGLYRRPGSSTVSLTVETDDRHALSALVMAGYSRDDGNASSWYGHGSLTIRPSTWMELNPAIYLSAHAA